MKVKDLERTANLAWSPKSYSPILLAVGTAAQQLDASFSTNAALEIYSLNLSEPGFDLKQECSFPSEHRYHKIIWGACGENQTAGTIIGGCDSGIIKIYNASKLLRNENGLIMQQEKHTGPVHALDFNPFQHNLFATGASESEIFIWDMNNLQTAMSPGSKSQPLEDVLSLSWNRQVQHILASTFASKCVIWDLRKNEPIIKLTDTVSRVRWKVVAWHPEVATQLCLASEEDHSPVIQIWDLRFATSPLKTLENHQRGILSLAWCSDDPDLLVSCGKDNRILCWNPSSNEANGEVLAEIAKTNQWSFDVSWCPKNPAVIACPSFDGHISVYSLMGGKTQQFQTSDKIADSFPGMEGYVQAPVIQQQNLGPVSVDLAKPPKWLKRPVGASFSFGGKLIMFENEKSSTQQIQSNIQNGIVAPALKRSVHISQVVTEPELTQKSLELEQALEEGNFIEYCKNKAEETKDQHKKYIWHYIKANFHENPRAEILNLLGYKIEDVNSKLNEVLGKDLKNNINELEDDFNNMTRIEDFDLIANAQNSKKLQSSFKILTGNDTEGLITQALLLGNVEAAVELCLQAKRFADALIISMTGGPDLLARTQRKYLDQTEGYVSSLISALVTEDWGSIINNCDIISWKEALAATLTHASDEDLPILCEQLGYRLENESNGNKKILEDAQLCYICSGSFEKLVTSWSDKTLSSSADLQDLVELVTFLQKAVERQGRQVQVSGSLADLLTEYAMILASQGNLQTALTYLGSSNNQKVSSLRDRLYVNLGQKPAYGQPVRQHSRHSVGRQSFTNYASFSTPNQFPVTNNQFVDPVMNITGSQPTHFGATQNFNSGVHNIPTSISQPWAQNVPISAPRTFSPVPPAVTPNQPPKGSNFIPSGTGVSSGLPSRKYVLDPSVSSNQYGVFPRNQVLANQPMGGYPNPQQSFNTSPLISSSIPNPSSTPIPSMNPMPLVPNIGGYGTGFTPPTHRQQAVVAQEAVEANLPNLPPSAPGWNDPPVVNKSLKNHNKTEAPQTVETITHPLHGVVPIHQSLPQMNNGYGDANIPQTQFGVPFNPQEQPRMFQPPNSNFGSPLVGPPTTFNPAAFSHNATASTIEHIPLKVDTKPVPVAKTPIPEQHIHMKTVFDELKNQCSCAANNPQLKRKLEDVGKKLESLYDLLRENKLSANTLASLHQMVQMIQNGNYQGGLSLHTQLVSGPDFAQIASFMPGLKVLLQCAIQMQVYLR
ncbi:hypothetical protein WA026_000448 [Henosepilachna vigintioctopunctata]|uniref:Protein transport protein Sec31A n=1 Tax=Henosepilachna vigintioctopunctata TaxID=420089 RepID=A0AAW1V8D8_9CUCU